MGPRDPPPGSGVGVHSLAPLVGPIAELDGRRVRITRTSLVDPGDGARRVEAGDGPIWIVASEPVADEAT